MNKKFKAAAAIAASALLSAGVAGCAGQTTKQAALTKDDLIEAAVDTFTKAESTDADASLEMDMNISAPGITMEIKNDSVLNIEALKDGTAHFTGKVNISALGQEREIDIDSYTVNEGSEMLQYYKITDGQDQGGWTYKRTAADNENALSELSVSQLSKLYTKLKDSLSELKLQDGTVDYNNTSCYLISGKITGEKLNEIISSTDQSLSDNNTEALEMMAADTSLYFRSSDNTPYAIEVDFKDSAKNIFEAQLSEYAQSFEFDAQALKAVIVFNSFDKVNEIKLPDEVKQSAVESADSIDVENLLMGI